MAVTLIDTIPTPSILESMIAENIIPPCIAVFLDYSPDRRRLEYYCDKDFTQFLANDFMSLLRKDHNLSITDDYKLTTIIGLTQAG